MDVPQHEKLKIREGNYAVCEHGGEFVFRYDWRDGANAVPLADLGDMLAGFAGAEVLEFDMESWEKLRRHPEVRAVKATDSRSLRNFLKTQFDEWGVKEVEVVFLGESHACPEVS